MDNLTFYDLERDTEILMIEYRQGVKDKTIDPQKTTWEDYYTQSMSAIAESMKAVANNE